MRNNVFELERDHPTLVAMHFLGGSAGEWDGVGKLAGPEYTWAKVDLPGFGEAAGVSGYTVAEMVEYLAKVLEELRPGRFVLVGHSLSGKVAMVAARRAADGDRRFAGMEGLVLAAASPPGPEPMSEGKRSKMLVGLDGSAEERRIYAESYLEENTGRTLAAPLLARAVEDVLRADVGAWRAWLEDGSREDWDERVGLLELPALVVAGESDADLGAEAQRRLVLPHLPGARMEEIAGVGHLLPLEAPAEMAELLRSFLGELGRRRAGMAAIAPVYLRLIESERVSAATRRELLNRAVADDPAYVPAALSLSEMETLRAVAERVLPQETGGGIDLAVRVDKRLALGTGKGWRYAELPGDVEAYRAGLAGLDVMAAVRHWRCFAELDAEQRDEVLAGIVSDGPGTGFLVSEKAGSVGALSGVPMVRWFEDVRAELVGIYVSHPATLGRMGYSGIADGGRSEAMAGFVELGMGKLEAWEPEAEVWVGSPQP